MRFAYDPAIVARYPDVVGGILLARGLRGGPTPPDLLDRYRAEQAAVRARIGDQPLSQIESLAAWRTVFRSFGVDPTQIRSAAEALLRRLTKQGDLPSINLLVDLGNLVAIRRAVPVAVMDMRAAVGGITVRFAAGDEPFINLGADAVEHPDPGEVIFIDDARAVYARRWCWRQSAASAAREDTTDVIITVEAHHSGARADIEAALGDLEALFRHYAGGTYQVGILDRDRIELIEQ
ncbi:MAG: B3/B4 domain-containing protein [Candidatus Flexifilum sp.]|jgi:DNA/RNA-binding domain of Phe-tRNA-synthetase-like protein